MGQPAAPTPEERDARIKLATEIVDAITNDEMAPSSQLINNMISADRTANAVRYTGAKRERIQEAKDLAIQHREELEIAMFALAQEVVMLDEELSVALDSK